MIEIIKQMAIANENYEIDWTRDLAGDTILSWTVSASDPSVIVTQETTLPSSTTFRLTGGVSDSFYEITVIIQTGAGNTIPKVIPFHCIRAEFIGANNDR